MYKRNPPQKVELNFLWVGTISYWTFEAVRSIVEIVVRIPGARLTLIGNGVLQVAFEVPPGSVVIPKGPQKLTTELLSQYSLVFGSGRVALESMAAGVPVCIMGKDGSDGLVTAANIQELAYSNFSGRTNPDIYSAEMYSTYALQLSAFLTDLDAYWKVSESYKELIRPFDVKVVVGDVEGVYKEAIAKYRQKF